MDYRTRQHLPSTHVTELARKVFSERVEGAHGGEDSLSKAEALIRFVLDDARGGKARMMALALDLIQEDAKQIPEFDPTRPLFSREELDSIFPPKEGDRERRIEFLKQLGLSPPEEWKHTPPPEPKRPTSFHGILRAALLEVVDGPNGEKVTRKEALLQSAVDLACDEPRYVRTAIALMKNTLTELT